MTEQTMKNDTKADPPDRPPENGHKSLSENDLHKGYGGDKPSRRDLRGFVKTIWAFSEKVDDLASSMDRLAERIDELINLK